MPQPISRVAPDASIFLNNIGMFRLRELPELASLAMECIATWATVESWMLNLYLDMAGGNRTSAAAMFLTLEANSARRAALAPLVETLQPLHQQLYAAIAGVMKSREKARNKLAHWVWGYTPDVPDAVLLADPKALALQSGGLDRDQIYVYRKDDFLAIIADNEELADWGMDFKRIINGHVSNHANQLYDALCKAPAIAERLHRQAQQG